MLPMLLMVPVLFIAGVVFAYFVVVPAAIKFLLNFNDDQFNIQIRAREYYSFFSLTLVSVGVLFQIPIGVLAVTRLGIVSPDQLAHNRRYAMLVIAVARDAASRHRPDHDADLDAAADPALRVQPDPRQGDGQAARRGRRLRTAGEAGPPADAEQLTLRPCSSTSEASESAWSRWSTPPWRCSWAAAWSCSESAATPAAACSTRSGSASNSNSSDDPAFESQIDRAEETLAANPEDEKALLALARLNFQAGQLGYLDRRERGALPDRGVAGRLRGGADAWQRYLDTKPKHPDDGVATLMTQVYENTLGRPPRASPSSRSASTAGWRRRQIVADARPSFGTYITLATWAYRSRGRQAGRAGRARTRSPRPATRPPGSRSTSAQAGRGCRARPSPRRQGERDRARSSSRTRSAASAASSSAAARQRRLAPTAGPPLATIRPPGPLAQLVEQETLNLKVAGSIPAWPIGARGERLRARPASRRGPGS